jgi:2-amino-4-hydroxy-6-hydroxymethyldihydropteridine diphosphokinase
METVYLGLGASAGAREDTVLRGAFLVESRAGLELEEMSSLFETAPVARPGGRDFVNAVARFRTALDPATLLAELLEVEARCGRDRAMERRAPGERPGGAAAPDRGLDLDLLYFGDLSLRGDHLVLPHPRIHQRAFVLVPLLEIEPGFRDPVTGVSALGSLRKLDDGARVRRISARRVPAVFPGPAIG